MNYKYISHTLKPLKQNKFLKDFCVFDIETSMWKNKPEYHNRYIEPFLLVFYDGEKTLHWTGKNCLIKFLKFYLTKKYRRKICFAHNGGKFDIIGLYQAFIEDKDLPMKYSFQPVMQGSRIMSFKIYDKNKNRWEFRDSYCLLPRSLDSLSKSFKPDHKKMKMPSKDDNMTKWVKYCANDCYALYDILHIFNNIISDIRGCIGYTIASTSLKTFRKRFLNRELETYFQYNNHFRKAYYGGRTEIFNMYARPKKKEVYYLYDINSMYPFVMKYNLFPVSKPKKTNYYDIRDCIGKTGIIDVTVETLDGLDIPILPFHRDDGKLIFPLGKWRGLYEFSFIEKCLEYGYHFKIHNAWEFDDDYLFKGYIDHFYSLKNNSEGAEREIYKLLLNSLYGKFGEISKRRRLITDPDISLTGKLPYDDHFGYALQEYYQYSPYHLPVISIKITTLAQLHLYKLFEKIKDEGGTIYYCDTDSVVTDIRLNTSKEIGDISLQEEFKEGIFLLPKVYYLKTFEGNKIKIKGFTEDLKTKVQDLNIWIKALQGDYTPFFEQKVRPASLNEIRIRHLKGFTTLLQNRNIITSYDKRKVLKDYNTIPITI